VIDELHLRQTPEQLMRNLVATLPTGTATVDVQATAHDPRLARDIANATVVAAAAQVREIQGKHAAASGVVRIQAVEPAGLPTSPSFPVRRRTYPLGLAAGLVLALLWGLFRQRTDTRLRSMDQIEAIAGVTALGAVPATKPLAEDHRQLGGRGARQAAEAFRQMRTNLRFVAVDDPPRAIVVTSSVAGEGKTTVAANLARVLARGGDPVVLIDADLRRPTLQTIFDVDDSVGLTEVLAGSVDVADVLQPGDEDHLRLLPAGRIPHNPSELVGSVRMRSLIADLARESFVIIDSPPLLPVTDAALLAAAADGALLVCRASRLRRDHLAQALRNLRGVDGRLLGVVVNAISQGWRASRQGYGYYAGAASVTSYEPVAGRRKAAGVTS
jgi:capsular exopolysaccharide synthesis family protein